MSSTFTPQATQTNPADPAKHVNYSVGMVLGVDDLTQEFTYLSARDRWLARDLLGYGTVCGLQVTADADAKGPRVKVSSGAALSPAGQLICVRPAQCAYIADWLNANQDKVALAMGSPPHSFLKLYLTLCYKDCLTDNVPIAGDPCRTADESVAPSRVVDDFKLEIRIEPPGQAEEEAMREFVDWLKLIEITDGGGPILTLEQFETLLRNEAASLIPAHPAKQFLLKSPPDRWRIHTQDACEFMRAAFRIWVTEFRPKFHPTCESRPCGCGGTEPALQIDECLLMAELDVTVTFDGTRWVVANAHDVQINERRRPFLINLGLLQEVLLCGPCRGEGGGGGTGLQGSPGLAGPPGPPGKDGKDGAAGKNGTNGTNGAPGTPGAPGDPGAPGKDGVNGKDGAPGKDGVNGKDGAPGPNMIVAAGRFDTNGKVVFTFGGLNAKVVQAPSFFQLSFTTYKPTSRYVTTGTAVTTSGAAPHVFEVVQLPDPKLPNITDAGGIVVRISTTDTIPLIGFMAQIMEIPG
jgi:hypothetical protein